jgi:hypothetical protein
VTGQRIALAAALAAALALPASAAGEEAPGSVAVLEFRAGSRAAPRIADRVAETLARIGRLEVIGLDAARRRFGPGLDAAVSSCGGRPGCVADLGARLGVDEILLVGVSELGDVILTLQRIGAGGAVASRLAEALPPNAAPSPDQLEAYLRRVFPAAVFERFGAIRVETDLAGAEVFLGERKIGATPLAPIRVRAPADYEVTVKKPGYAAFRARINVAAGTDIRVRPELARLGDDAWYKKWWVLAIAGGITAATIGTAIIVTRSDDVPVTVEPF